MQISLQGIGKRYAKNWIIRNVDLEIRSGEHIAILGKNGSGKSTLLKIISGYLSSTEGKVLCVSDGQELPKEKIYTRLGFVAPYMEIYDKLNFEELVDFHFSLRKYRPGSDRESILNALPLPTKTPLTSFSSGMLQRVKLLLAFHTDSELLIFDEPTMNLDLTWSEWFISQLQSLEKGQTVIVASNLPGSETVTCENSFHIDQLSS